MTYSVYNIKVDNQLSFTPGATAGYVLGINSDGSTSWIEGGGGSQTLEQVLALGNDVGTYSISSGASSSNLGSVLTLNEYNAALSSGGVPGGPWYGSSIGVATSSITIYSVDDENNSSTINLINNDIYLTANNLIELYGRIVMNGPINGTGSNFLTIDNVGNIGSTSSTTAGTAGTSGTSGISGTNGSSGTSGTSPNQNLSQTLLLGNTASTQIQLIDGSLAAPAISFINDDNTGFYKPFSTTQTGRIGVVSDGLFIMGLKSNDFDVLQLRSQAGFTSSTGLYQMLSFATGGGSGKWKFNLDTDVETLRLDRWDGSNGLQARGMEFATSSISIFGGGATSAVFNSSGVRIPSITNSLLAVDSTGQIIATSSTGGGSTTGSIGIVLDGAGTTITTGVKSSIQIPYSGTITGWTILADQVGSIVVDVWKDDYATYPPSSLDSIAGSEKPTLSSSIKNEDNSLSTWTTSVNAGDIITFNVDSASTLTRVNLAIKITKS